MAMTKKEKQLIEDLKLQLALVSAMDKPNYDKPVRYTQEEINAGSEGDRWSNKKPFKFVVGYEFNPHTNYITTSVAHFSSYGGVGYHPDLEDLKPDQISWSQLSGANRMYKTERDAYIALAHYKWGEYAKAMARIHTKIKELES